MPKIEIDGFVFIIDQCNIQKTEIDEYVFIINQCNIPKDRNRRFRVYYQSM